LSRRGFAIAAESDFNTYKVAGVVGAAIVIHVGDYPVRKSNVPKQSVATVQQQSALRKSLRRRDFRSGCTPQYRSDSMPLRTNAPSSECRSKRVSTWDRVEPAGRGLRNGTDERCVESEPLTRSLGLRVLCQARRRCRAPERFCCDEMRGCRVFGDFVCESGPRRCNETEGSKTRG
jgi:hypothetical protein